MLPPSVLHVHGSFESFSLHLHELRDFAPDVVIDTVPYRDKQGQGISHFVGVAVRAVVVTSGDVYRAFGRIWGTEPGRPDAVPLTEESPLRSKPSPDLDETIDDDNVEVERMVAEIDLPTTIVRASVIFGPNDPLHRLHRYLKRMDDGRPAIRSSSRRPRRRPAGKTYNVGPARTLTEREWVAALAEAHG